MVCRRGICDPIGMNAAKRATIVVIDDDFGIRESVKDLLALEDWDCVIAESGEKGLALVREIRPELVVTDIQLPDITGFEVCQTLKRDPVTKRLPVVMMTGRFTERDDRIQGFESGADEYFLKPFEPQFFISRIRSILRGITPQVI